MMDNKFCENSSQWKPINYFEQKNFILDVWLGPKYPSDSGIIEVFYHLLRSSKTVRKKLDSDSFRLKLIEWEKGYVTENRKEILFLLQLKLVVENIQSDL